MPIDLHPLIERSLRTRSRQWWTYGSRLGAVLMASLIVGVALVIQGLSSNIPFGGRILFYPLWWFLLLFCCFEGLRAASDSLSREKRDGTLGLLFLTRLRGIDVVLGTLAGQLFPVVYILLGALPVLGIPLLFGGVSSGEYWRGVLAIFSMLWQCATLGMLVSAVGKHPAKCLVAALFFLFVLFMWSWIAVMLSAIDVTGFLDAASSCSAWTLCFLSPDASYASRPRQFWIAAAGSHLVGWILLAIAAWRLQVVREPVTVTATSRTRTAFRNRPIVPEKTADAPATRFRFHGGPLEGQNPALWLALRQRPRLWLVWSVLIGVYGVSWLVTLLFGSMPGSWLTGSAAHFVTGWLLRVGVAMQSAQWPADSRRDGLFELLFSTPLQGEELLRGHRDAVVQTWRSPLLFCVAMQTGQAVTAFLLFHPTAASGGAWTQPALQALLALYQTAILVLDLATLYWVGTWWGIRTARPMAAAIRSLLFVQILPAFLFCLPSIVVDLCFLGWSRTKLWHEFRKWAGSPLDSAESQPGWAASVGSLFRRKPPLMAGMS